MVWDARFFFALFGRCFDSGFQSDLVDLEAVLPKVPFWPVEVPSFKRTRSFGAVPPKVLY